MASVASRPPPACGHCRHLVDLRWGRLASFIRRVAPVVAVPVRDVRSANLVPQAILAACAAVFLIVAGYNTFQVWATASHPPDKQSLDDLAKVQRDERLLLTAREQRALQANPLDSDALKKLAALARADGKQKQADELILLAANRSLRDPEPLAEVLPALFARKDFAGVLYRIDGLIRSKPELMPNLLPIAAAFAQARESRSALLAVLAQNPPWRAQLVSHMAEKEMRPEVIYGLLAGLRSTVAPPTIDELRILLSRLVKDHDFETGYFVWLDFLTDRELHSAANIFDGGFELDAKHLFFDWTYIPMANVELHTVPRATSATDRVLRIDFINPRSRFANLSQLLRLPPGSYLFSGEVKAAYEQVDNGLIWRLYCIEEQERLIAQTSRPHKAEGWTRFELKLEIPASGCQTQRLQLELDARAALDNQITGSVSYDTLAITTRP
jgi:hypothetical protein